LFYTRTFLASFLLVFNQILSDFVMKSENIAVFMKKNAEMLAG